MERGSKPVSLTEITQRGGYPLDNHPKIYSSCLFGREVWYIHFLRKRGPLETTEPTTELTFDSLNLNPALKRAVREMGYEKPSPIQAQALPILLGGPTDFMGLAATGTGKTAAFSLPLLERLDASSNDVQALILCPTRELSMQVAGQVALLGKYLNIRSIAVYGGSSYEDQFRALKRGAQVVVGTPGRMIDHIERGTLNLDNVKLVVLDEADEMISMGFREDMEFILQKTPQEGRNTWLFSATMSSSVRHVADEFLKSPKKVQVNRSEMLSSGVEQYYYMTHEKNKPEVLCKLIDAAEDFYGVIFCQMKALVVDLTRYLQDRGYKVDCLHGDMSQTARETAMNGFRKRRTQILVCTDVAARGLDVKDITHVINFSLPRELDNYVHRIGRTARSGKTGIAMSLVTPSHRHLVQKIERLTKSKMSEGQVPTRKSIGLKKISQMLGEFTEQPNAARALELMNDEWKQAVASMKPEEVAARFLVMKFPWVFSEKVQPQMERSENAGPTRPRDVARNEERGRAYQERRANGEGKPERTENSERSEFRPPRKDDARKQRAANYQAREERNSDYRKGSRADRPPRRHEERGGKSAQQKDERREIKRAAKRDFKKKFVKPFQKNNKKRAFAPGPNPRPRP